MSCSFLDGSGVPTPCFLQWAELVTAASFSPFVVFRIWCQVNAPNRSTKLSISAASCRLAASWLSLVPLLSVLLPNTLVSLPVAAVLAAVSVLHYTERKVHVERVASTELLLWWTAQTGLLSLWAVVQPAAINTGVAVCAGLVGVLELCSSPWSPQGYEDASIFGRVNVSFLNSMMFRAQKEQLNTSSFADKPRDFDTHSAHADFMRTFEGFSPRSRHRLIWSLLLFCKRRFFFFLAVSIVADVVSYTQPLLLSLFLSSLQTVSVNSVYLAISLGAARLLVNTLTGLKQLASRSIYTTSRAALMQTIYHKSLTIDSDARAQYDASRVMNLLDVDTKMVQNTYQKISSLIGAPLGLVLCTFQLYMFMGKSTLAAVPLYMLYVPYTSWNSQQWMKKLPESMRAKDKRAESTLSIMRNMKSLKLYAWEEPYAAHVVRDRQSELAFQQQFMKLTTLFRAVTSQLDNLVATAVLMAFLYFSREPLTPQIVFPTLSMISLVSDPLFELPSTLNTLGRAFTSQKRILDFLEQPDEQFDNFYRLPGPSLDDFDTALVHVSRAHIFWGKQPGAAVAVEPLDLRLTRGDLCCVLGKVGSGKSALLKALCGQMTIRSGSVTVRGSMAYASQEPWLQFQSLRENILFGLEYDEQFYNKTIQSCDLESDIALFPDGDATEIGEKGISLSGGQKARVALARAVYSRADIIVLDDVLSAVDQHVAKKLLRELFAPDGLLSSRVVILATHSVRSLKYASHLICLAKEAKVVYNGPPSLAGPKALESATGGSSNAESAQDLLPALDFDRRSLARQHFQTNSRMQPGLGSTNPKVHYIPEVTLRKDKHKDVPVFATTRRYMETAGRGITFLALLGLIGGVISSNLIPIWLAIWSDKGLVGLRASELYVNVFLCIVLSAAVLSALASYLFLGTIALRASQTLHDDMLKNVIRAPMVFFERTPLGTIMNRFTGDISTLDNSFPSTIYSFIRVACTTFANLFIACVGSPFILVALIPLLLRYLHYRRLYVPARRQIQQLSTAANGPILSHIEESIRGAATVSVFGRQHQFIEGYEQRSDYWMHVAFLQWAVQRWLNCRIVSMTAFLTALSAVSIVFLVRFASMPVGVAGVVLYTVRQGVARLTALMSSWTSIEVNVVGVERVFGYIDQSTEAPYRLPPSEQADLSDEWPLNGEISLKSYSTRFRPDLEDALHNISLSIGRREKIGVVGRTGAGKSTLTIALFRLLEARTGMIEIDGVNTTKIGLYDLRSRLSIIPQDAQIFKGTLRENLDPLGLNDDVRLWQVLELCHLKTHFERGLDMSIEEGGANISRGQAQLICLGRALLRKTSILVLDEATASVDNNTDSLVQSTIRHEFKDRTIITIAHRLDTVMDSDRILVLDKGSVVEFDAPQALLSREGAFYKLYTTHETM